MNSSQPLSFSGTSDFSVVNSTAPAGNITTGTATGTATAAAAAALSQQSSPRTDASLQDFVFICGYGRVGQLVCEMLDRKCIPYVVLDSDPQRAREARNKGLPVYYGTYVLYLLLLFCRCFTYYLGTRCCEIWIPFFKMN